MFHRVNAIPDSFQKEPFSGRGKTTNAIFFEPAGGRAPNKILDDRKLPKKLRGQSSSIQQASRKTSRRRKTLAAAAFLPFVPLKLCLSQYSRQSPREIKKETLNKHQRLVFQTSHVDRFISKVDWSGVLHEKRIHASFP